MMRITMTPTAQRRLDHYLAEVRRFLQGSSSVDSREVERDIIDHIETSFEGRGTPVDTLDLDGVLRDLGEPEQWVPDAERNWRQASVAKAQGFADLLAEAGQSIASHLRYGPEDFRLAYLSFGFLALTILFAFAQESPALLLVFAPVTFVLARAALEFAEAPEKLRGQHWLLYPSLLLIYVPLGALLVAWPFIATFGFFEFASEVERSARRGMVEDVPLVLVAHPYITALLASVATTSLWWTILGIAAWRWPAVVRAVFHPFASRFAGRTAGILGLIALLLFVASIIGAVSFLSKAA